MGFFQKILCILTAFVFYSASTSSSGSIDVKHISNSKWITIIAEPIGTYDSFDEINKQLSCLQKNIYFEAAVESTAGKLAVAHVTYNRVKNKEFPSTFCDVIYEGKHYASGFPKKSHIFKGNVAEPGTLADMVAMCTKPRLARQK